VGGPFDALASQLSALKPLPLLPASLRTEEDRCTLVVPDLHGPALAVPQIHDAIEHASEGIFRALRNGLLGSPVETLDALLDALPMPDTAHEIGPDQLARGFPDLIASAADELRSVRIAGRPRMLDGLPNPSFRAVVKPPPFGVLPGIIHDAVAAQAGAERIVPDVCWAIEYDVLVLKTVDVPARSLAAPQT
jgi:hypothetical protein